MTTNLMRAIALKEFLNEEYFVIEDKAYEGEMYDDVFVEDNYIEIEELEGGMERDGYIVLTDAEADEMWEEQLDNYLEECIYDSLPDWLRGYFDEEAWKRDARMDGRGHSLATYDGHEHYERVYDTDFYIYRIN